MFLTGVIKNYSVKMIERLKILSKAHSFCFIDIANLLFSQLLNGVDSVIYFLHYLVL